MWLLIVVSGEGPVALEMVRAVKEWSQIWGRGRRVMRLFNLRCGAESLLS